MIDINKTVLPPGSVIVDGEHHLIPYPKKEDIVYADIVKDKSTIDVFMRDGTKARLSIQQFNALVFGFARFSVEEWKKWLTLGDSLNW